MMRVVKEADERRNEILDTAEALFNSKGYEQTTINDILSAIGIAKGTFYYYFKSKDEVMDAIVTRTSDIISAYARQTADDPNLSVKEKLIRIFTMGFPSDMDKQQMIDNLHIAENARMHQKTLVLTIQTLSPVLSDIIEQGISEGLLKTLYPKESAENILAATQFLFDEGLFNWQPEELRQKIEAQIYIIERILGADEGSLRYIAQFFKF